MKKGIAASDSKIIGTLREGGDLAYVVVRSASKDTDVTKVEVITLKRSGTECKTLLPEGIQVMVETFKRTQQLGPLKSGPVTDTVKPEARFNKLEARLSKAETIPCSSSTITR